MKKTVLIISILMSLTFSAYAEEVVLDTTPSPQYTEYINTPMLLSDEYNDYQPPILSLVSPAVLQSTELPEKYDARTENRIYDSGVGQRSDGTCWAFASTLCAETALGAKVDLSEQHAKYSMSNTGNNTYGYIRLPSEGGNFKMYTAYAASWRGIVLEEDDPHTYGYQERDYATVTSQKPVSYHMQETIEIPNPKEKVNLVTPEERAAHVNEVKYYVYKYGCCFSSIRWLSTYKNDDGTAYFNNEDTKAINHAICIVGWDDGYSKENFKNQPKNDGAFIIKNSQGLTGSYCYLSYEDVYAGWDASCIVSVEDKYNYGENYNYNYYEPGAKFSALTAPVTCTNVFTSKHHGEYISAVGTLTKARNMIYNVYISTTDDGTEYGQDSYELVAAGVFEMPGYHTVKLDEPFLLGEAGTKFCVRFVYYCNGNPFDVPVEIANGDKAEIKIENINANPGQSYFWVGNTIYDMGASNNANMFINAFTDADYDITFSNDIYGTYSINGNEYTACKGSFTSGLNDEITINFESKEGTTAYYINDTKYSTDESVTLKITQPLKITAEKKVEITASSDDEGLTLNTYRNCTTSYVLGLTTAFTKEHNIYAALYSGNKLVGIKSLSTSESKEHLLIVNCSEKPDTVKLITISPIASPMLPMIVFSGL